MNASAKEPETGHSVGTLTVQAPVNAAKSRPAQDARSSARLLDLRSAAAYLSVSYWTVRDFILNGTIPSVKLPCPRARDGRTIRRVLIDRNDLDRLIEDWKETT